MICYKIHFLNNFKIDSNDWLLIMEYSNEAADLYPLGSSLLIFKIGKSLWSVIVLMIESDIHKPCWICYS